VAIITIKTFSKDLQLRLEGLRASIRPEALLKIAGEIVVGSVKRTFREQGYPENSWKPLAASTIKKRRNKKKGSIKILQDTARLVNSVTYKINGNRVVIGPSKDIPYAEIHQRGGLAGRKPPFKKKDGKRASIPARPYMVLRAEDPERIREGMQRYVEQQIRKEGLSK
jgi:phage virion morphogenesis protein